MSVMIITDLTNKCHITEKIELFVENLKQKESQNGSTLWLKRWLTIYLMMQGTRLPSLVRELDITVTQQRSLSSATAEHAL